MLEREPLELNGDFQYALDLIERTDQNLFITGRAGTGKSTLLQLFRNTTRKKTVVVAPTGVAALNVGGQTIHSFFGFPPRMLNRADIKKRRNRRMYKNLEVLVIDEISMVRADLLDHIDYFLRLNREDMFRPFGGVQVVFFGDLFQLPPVVASDAESMLFQMQYATPYFFSAAVLETMPLQALELKKVYRQENRRFLRLLEAVRLNRVDHDDLQDLNERYLPPEVAPGFYITLTARNATADRINRLELEKIDYPVRHFRAAITGDFKSQLYPTEALLPLKLDAQVMFVKNDPDKRFVNGTIGKVHRLFDERVEVLVTEGGKEELIDVSPMEWEIIRYLPSAKDPTAIETETIGTFTQLPLKLAWAITIHKSQGKTFDRVVIDLGSGAFEHGQTYVALSRCRSLEGIVLSRPIRSDDIRTDERIVEFYQQYF